MIAEIAASRAFTSVRFLRLWRTRLTRARCHNVDHLVALADTGYRLVGAFDRVGVVRARCDAPWRRNAAMTRTASQRRYFSHARYAREAAAWTP